MNGTPPKFLQSVIGLLLPPARRDLVLGDLEEQFRAAPPSRALRQYVFEVRHLLPAILREQLRTWSTGPGIPAVLQTGSGIPAVRRQVEEFQHENHSRLLFYLSMTTLLSAFITWQILRAEAWFPRLFGCAFILLLFYTARQHHARSVSPAVPEAASLSVLVAFYQRELARRRDFLRTLWYWKMVPLAAPVLAIVILKRNWQSASTLMWTVACFALTNLAARSQARGIQQWIDQLEAQDR